MKSFISLRRALVLVIVADLVLLLVSFIALRWAWPYLEGYARATALRDFWQSIFGG